MTKLARLKTPAVVLAVVCAPVMAHGQPAERAKTAAEPDGAARPDDAEMTELPLPRHRWVWDSLAALRMNPRGAIVRFRAGYRYQLWDRPGILYERSHLSLMTAADLTPAYTRIGAVAIVQPLAVLRLWARLDYLASYGAFSYTRSFDSPRADHSERLLSRTLDRSYAAAGHQLTLGALARAKHGNWVVQSQTELMHAGLGLHYGDTVFFEGYLDMLYPNDGWGIGNDTDLVYLFDNGFRLALRYTVGAVFYEPRHWGRDGPPLQTDPNGPTHRIGPALIYTLGKDEPGSANNQPTVALLTQWWLRHRYRAGAEIDQAFPFALVVLMQQGDLVPIPRRRSR